MKLGDINKEENVNKHFWFFRLSWDRTKQKPGTHKVPTQGKVTHLRWGEKYRDAYELCELNKDGTPNIYKRPYADYSSQYFESEAECREAYKAMLREAIDARLTFLNEQREVALKYEHYLKNN